MTISILKLSAGQTIARPFSRACGWDEACELVGFAIAAEKGITRPSNDKAESLGKVCVYANLDTETPIHALADGSKFYAFREI